MWHPIRYVVATQTRLAVTAVLASGALIALSLWLDWIIDTRSHAPGLNSALFVVWLLTILGVSWIEALFVGDLLFPRGWRGYLMLSRGQKPRAAGRDGRREESAESTALADMRDDRRRYRSYTPHFSFALGLLVVGNMLLVGELRSGVLWRIDEVQLETALRADDVETRVRAIDRVTRLLLQGPLEHFTDRLVELVDDPDAEVARTAVQGLAHIARRMRHSMEELRRSKQPQRWEKDLYDRLVRTQGERLLTRFRHRPEMRPALAEALGALEVTDAIQQFGTFLWQEKPDRETVRAIILAVGDLRDLHGLTVPLDVLGSEELGEDEDLQAVASWAIGEILTHHDPERFTREPQCIPLAVDALSAELPRLQAGGRCALLDAFARFRDARAGAALFAMFDVASDADRCERREIARRFGPPTVAATEEPLRLKVLRAVAAIATGNDEVIDWLRRRARRPDLSDPYRREIENILAMAESATAEQKRR